VPVYQLDPLRDGRWVELLERHEGASIFHTRGWLHCLQETYGYEPFVLTTSPPHAELTNGLVFCRVKSWLSGDRMVSLPFADHCEPLFERTGDFFTIIDWLSRESSRGARRRVELRPRGGDGLDLLRHTQFRVAQKFHLHVLDLRPDLHELSSSLDRDSVQRRLRRVERGNLVYEEGNSPNLLKQFYYLQVLTRRRHRLPPQPLQWFVNLLHALRDHAKIRVVSFGGAPVASILTLRYKEAAVFKYGCSDARYHHLGGVPFLLWEAIREAKHTQAKTFDMGRSDPDNAGLIAFKSHWGAVDVPLSYWQYPPSSVSPMSLISGIRRLGGRLVALLPDSMLIFLGKTLYKHVG